MPGNVFQTAHLTPKYIYDRRDYAIESWDDYEKNIYLKNDVYFHKEHAKIFTWRDIPC